MNFFVPPSLKSCHLGRIVHKWRVESWKCKTTSINSGQTRNMGEFAKRAVGASQFLTGPATGPASERSLG